MPAGQVTLPRLTHSRRFVCAYPSFQVQELEAVAEVYQAANGRPVIVVSCGVWLPATPCLAPPPLVETSCDSLRTPVAPVQWRARPVPHGLLSLTVLSQDRATVQDLHPRLQASLLPAQPQGQPSGLYLPRLRRAVAGLRTEVLRSHGRRAGVGRGRDADAQGRAAQDPAQRAQHRGPRCLKAERIASCPSRQPLVPVLRMCMKRGVCPAPRAAAFVPAFSAGPMSVRARQSRLERRRTMCVAW